MKESASWDLGKAARRILHPSVFELSPRVPSKCAPTSYDCSLLPVFLGQSRKSSRYLQGKEQPSQVSLSVNLARNLKQDASKLWIMRTLLLMIRCK